MAEGRRLSCAARVEADVVIDVPASSQVHRQVVRKDAAVRAIELHPVVRLHYVQVQPPDMHDPSGDLRRLYDALELEWRLTGLSCDLSVLQTLQGALRAGAWQVTVAVHGGRQIIGVWPGLHEQIYGLAVDVGSTTIAAHLCDLTERRSRGIRRRHEPADPLWRGPHEPGVVLDDEPGRRGADDRGGARGAERAGRRRGAQAGSASRTFSRPPWSAIRSCITCCSASIRSNSAARRSRWPAITR